MTENKFIKCRAILWRWTFLAVLMLCLPNALTACTSGPTSDAPSTTRLTSTEDAAQNPPAVTSEAIAAAVEQLGSDSMATFDSNYDNIRPAGSGRVLNVGEGQQYATPQEAYKASQPGDTIVIHGGTYSFAGNEYNTYPENHPILISHDVSFVGVGDVTFDIGQVAKGGLVTGAGGDLYVENISFENAWNREFNGAAIRHQSGENSGDLIVVNSNFVGNQNGILGGGGSGTEVIVKDSTFHDNGHGDGKSHAIYVNSGDSLVVESSVFTGTNEGHHVKSIADHTVVRNSTLGDGNDTASMAIDINGGGDVIVEGNTIYESQLSSNSDIIYYDTSRGDSAGTLTVRDNNVVNQGDTATFVAVSLTDRPYTDVVLENNQIQSGSDRFQLSDSAYTADGNTFNGSNLADGTFDPDWPVGTRDLPTAVGEVPLPAMEFSWLADGGQYLMAGWGTVTLTGTSGRDVLEARQKGTKTLEGGVGDDVYLPWGQAKVVEKADEGTDWIVQSSASNAYYMPENVEGFALHAEDAYSNAVFGNDADNVFVGATGGKNEFRGEAGDDVMYGGGGSGNSFAGGAGHDTYILSGMKAEYTISAVKVSGQVTGYDITYADGGVDTVGANVERLVFDDATVDTSTIAPTGGESDSDGATGSTDDDGSTNTDPDTGTGGSQEDSSTDVPDTSSPDTGDNAFLDSFPDISTDPPAPVNAPLALWSDNANWLGDGGTYKSAGWGKQTLEGTTARDVLEAQTKGTKTLKGGDGDDIYLGFGQHEVVEFADSGYDWLVKDSTGWAYQMPDNVEGLYLATRTAYQKTVKGNSTDNTFIGAAGGNNDFDGRDGDDVMYGGGGSGNTFKGGAGQDTYLLDGDRADYSVRTVMSNGALAGYEITHGDGGTDTLGNDVEYLRFEDGSLDLAKQTWEPASSTGSDTPSDGNGSSGDEETVDGGSEALAAPDDISVAYGETVRIDALANDTGVTSLNNVSNPAAGSAWIGDDGALYYQAAVRSVGGDVFNYTAASKDGTEVSGTVNVQVNPETFTSDNMKSYVGQDVDSGGALIEAGTGFDLQGNTWQLAQFDYDVTPNTVLKFVFKVEELGEIQGVGVEADADWNNGNDLAFALAGSQTDVADWDSFNYDYHGIEAGSWASVKIDLGEHYQGRIENLSLINDHDVSDSSAKASIKNILVYEEDGASELEADSGLDDTIGDSSLSFNEEDFHGYGGNQDVNGAIAVADGGGEFEMSGNTWKRADVSYEATEQTVLSFEFKADSVGELHGIGVESDDTWDNGNDVAFMLAGTQEDVGGRASLNFDYHAPTQEGWQRYEIDLGEYYTGEVSSLTFINDEDVKEPVAQSMFRNVELSDVG